MLTIDNPMKTKRLISFGFIAALFLTLAGSFLLPSTAYAAVTGQWVDKSKITINGKNYIDNDVSDKDYQYHLNGDDDPKKCVEVIKNFNNADLSKATEADLVDWQSGSTPCVPKGSPEKVTIDPATSANANTAPKGSPDGRDSCESSGGMAWILCPIIKGLDAAMDWLDDQIQALLEVDQTAYDNPELYRAWSQIRDLAYIILLPIMFVMVIGTAMGSELFSAYTVKKALPRMVAAILFITASYMICTFLIGFANVVGGGILGLMTSPFNSLVGPGKTVAASGLSELFDGNNDILATILAGPKIAAAVVGVILILVFFGSAILLFVATAFMVLLLRQVFIVALLLVSPLAILAWIFPGNDKLWKIWWGSFSKLLIMFPLIMALVAVGRDMAWIVNNGGGGSLQGTFIKPVSKLALYMLPYAFIPFTFKFAGGAFATISGMAQDKGKGISGFLKKGRANKLQRGLNGKLFAGGTENNMRGAFNKHFQTAGMVKKAGLRPSLIGGNIRTARQDIADKEKHEAKEDKDVQGILNYDDAADAAAHSTNAAEAKQNLLTADDRRYENAYRNFDRTAFNDGWRERTGHDATEEEIEQEAQNAGNAARRYRNPRDLNNDVARIERVRKKYSPEAFQQLFAMQSAAGGTASATAADALLTLANSYDGDDASLMNAIAEFRKVTLNAGRVDQGGASQGVTYDTARWLKARMAEDPANAEQHMAEANRRIHAGVIDQQGESVLSHPSMKMQSVNNLIPEINARLDRAIATGDKYEIDLAMADISAIQESLRGSSPQIRNAFANQVLNRGLVLTQQKESVKEMFLDTEEQVMVEPQREQHVRDPGTGNVTVTVIPPKYETQTKRSERSGVTVLEALTARRESGSLDIQSKAGRDYGGGSAAARAAQAARGGGPPPPPGAAAGGGDPSARPGGP